MVHAIKKMVAVFAITASVGMAFAFTTPRKFADVNWYYTGSAPSEGWKTEQQIISANPGFIPVCNATPQNDCLRVMAQGDDPELDTPVSSQLGSFALEEAEDQ